MPNKMMYKNDKTCLLLHEDKIYVRTADNSDFSHRAITVTPGFQLELGRKIDDYKEAMKYSRLPLFFKHVTNREINGENLDYYLFVRMKTGRVDDKVIASIICKSGILYSISFNRDLIKDKEYRRYNQLSILHQISIPKDLNGFSNRSEQLIGLLKKAIPCEKDIKVVEKDNNLAAIVRVADLLLKYTFIKDVSTNKYLLVSISLAGQGE